MKFRGLLATDLSGSLDGVVASRNASGAYLRSRSTPVNPNSSSQQLVRSIFASLTQAWQLSLSDAQRAGWRAYAEALTTTDAIGNSLTLQAANWYVACNVGRLQFGVGRVDDAPTTLALAEAPAIDWASSFFTIGGGNVALVAGNIDWGAVDDAFMTVGLGNVQAPTRNFYKSPFSFDGALEGDSATPLTNPLLYTPSSLPGGLAIGNKLPVRVRLYLPDGRISIAESGLVEIAA